jgi:hypothetical protein
MTWTTRNPLPIHAPPNAAYGRRTGLKSFLGGTVWEWADAEGRSLGESNSVPANTVGECSRPGQVREPKEVVIDLLTLRKLRFVAQLKRQYPKAAIVIANDGYYFAPYISWMEGEGPVGDKDPRNRAIEADPELETIRRLENGGGFAMAMRHPRTA